MSEGFEKLWELASKLGIPRPEGLSVEEKKIRRRDDELRQGEKLQAELGLTADKIRYLKRQRSRRFKSKRLD